MGFSLKDAVFVCHKSKKVKGGCEAQLRKNLSTGVYRRYGEKPHKHRPEIEEQLHLIAVNAITTAAADSREQPKLAFDRLRRE